MANNDLNILNFQKYLDSKECRKKIKEYKDIYYEVLYKSLPSPYSVDHPSSNYAIYLLEVAEELARLRCLFDRIQNDNYFQTVQPMLIRQNLASVLNYDTVPYDWSHEKYRRFLLAVLKVLLGGSTKANIKNGIQIFTSLDVKITEFLDFIPRFLSTNLGSYFNNLTSVFNGDGRVGFKEFTFNDTSYQRFVYSSVDQFGFRIDLDFTSGNNEEYFRSWASHFRDIYWLMEIIKPAHTYYLIRNIFGEKYDTLNKLQEQFFASIFWEDMFSQGIFKFNDLESLFNNTAKLLNKAILFDRFYADVHARFEDDFYSRQFILNNLDCTFNDPNKILNNILFSDKMSGSIIGNYTATIPQPTEQFITKANWADDFNNRRWAFNNLNSTFNGLGILNRYWFTDKLSNTTIISTNVETIPAITNPNSSYEVLIGSFQYNSVFNKGIFNFPQNNNLIADSGTGTWSGGILTDLSKSWTPNNLIGLTIVDKTKKLRYPIISNTNNTLQVVGLPGYHSADYIISPKSLNLGTWLTGTITVDDSPWTGMVNQLKGATLVDVSNSNNYYISSNTINTITVTSGPVSGRAIFYVTNGLVFNQAENTSSQFCKYLVSP